jgi:hypothetical protein
MIYIANFKTLVFKLKNISNFKEYNKFFPSNIYIPKTIILHEIPLAMRTLLNFNTTFHPQTNGQFEKIIQTYVDMLRI